MEHEGYQELLALHALNALDASEGRSLEEHLAGCAECQSELDELRDATALLAHASTPAAPRDEVRARILNQVRAESPTTAGATTADVVPLRPRPAPRTWPRLLQLAAAVAFVALLLGMVVFWRRDVRQRREIAQLSHQLNSRERELTRDRDVLARQRDVLALLNSPNAKKMELAGSQTAQNARAMFVFDQKSGHGMLMTEGLPMAPRDMAYEVWFIPRGHSPMPGKMFTVDALGHAMITDEMPLEARQDSVIAITLEPKVGSASPTGPIYLSSPAS
jgi:anti-sigma-K factor RskA